MVSLIHIFNCIYMYIVKQANDIPWVCKKILHFPLQLTIHKLQFKLSWTISSLLKSMSYYMLYKN